jgi:hypothetical protein
MDLAALVKRPDSLPTEKPQWREEPPRAPDEKIKPRDLAPASRLPNGGWSLRGEPEHAPARRTIDLHANDGERMVELEADVAYGFAGRHFVQQPGERWFDRLREAAKSVASNRARIVSELKDRDRKFIDAIGRGDHRATY